MVQELLVPEAEGFLLAEGDPEVALLGRRRLPEKVIVHDPAVLLPGAVVPPVAADELETVDVPAPDVRGVGVAGGRAARPQPPRLGKVPAGGEQPRQEGARTTGRPPAGRPARAAGRSAPASGPATAPGAPRSDRCRGPDDSKGQR